MLCLAGGDVVKEQEQAYLELWEKNQEFDKIIHYIDLLKEPSVFLLGKKASALNNVRRYYEALDVLHAIKDVSQQDYLWHYRYGYTLMCLEKYAQAEESFLTALALNKDHMNTWFLLHDLYLHYLLDDDKLYETAEMIKQFDATPELLHDMGFCKQQQFNKDYVLFEGTQALLGDKIDNVLAAYNLFIQGLENVIKEEVQIIPLAYSLAQTLQPCFGPFTDMDSPLLADLIDELVYILYWFGVSDKAIVDITEPFIDALLCENHHIDSGDLALLNRMAYFQDYQGIVNFYLALPYTKRNAQYKARVIDAFIQLKQYEEAENMLQPFMYEAMNTFYWSYLYALLRLGQKKYEDAEQHLLCACQLDPKQVRIWELLEVLYRDILCNEEKMNWARNQREKNR